MTINFRKSSLQGLQDRLGMYLPYEATMMENQVCSAQRKRGLQEKLLAVASLSEDSSEKMETGSLPRCMV